MARKPNPVDEHVGGRIRLRRTLLGLSQAELGDALELTFQQIQKYERGTNRIGAGRLYRVSTVLGVPISFFFEEIPFGLAEGKVSDQAEGQSSEDGLLTTRETLQLVRYYYRIRNEDARKLVYDLVQELAKPDQGHGANPSGLGRMSSIHP